MELTNKTILRNYEFTYIENAITTLMADLSKKFRMYSDSFPVYMFNNGDELFLLNWQDSKGVIEFKKSSDLYQVNPRLELSPEAPTITLDQLTNPYVQGTFNVVIDKKEYQFKSYVKRIPLNLIIHAELSCDNFLKSMSYTELILSMMYRLNMFEFFSNKRRFQATYTISDSIDNQAISLGHDAENRNKKLMFDITLNLQFPAFDFFKDGSITNASNVIKNIGGGIYIEEGVKNNEFSDETVDKVIEDSKYRVNGGDGTINDNGWKTEDGNLIHGGSITPDGDGSGDGFVGGVLHPNPPIPGIIDPKKEYGIIEHEPGVYYHYPQL